VDQRELVRKDDADKHDGFVIVLIMHLQDPDNLIQESREFGSIVTDWYQARGALAEGVNLIAVSDPVYHKAITDYFLGIHALDVTLRPIFNKISFELALHNAAGAKLSEYAFAPGEVTRDGVLEQCMGNLAAGQSRPI